ncbi:HlyD family secretion protein [Chitinophaga sp. Cy-1792]|uniref:HlyD family secretion protein n=1 Tax=Chitinophaga sp. Cy-1792 TaxID=2608339 RepID=UPI0014214102|nr:HlyD family efflux transporter periplasmic adaptor subunit [Chitinophaga sp. Cy-1792]NIG57561.1 HlyD family efflux transporter periplasmic adaptor subunit [Chitinophaga sp. Cy-1792]
MPIQPRSTNINSFQSEDVQDIVGKPPRGLLRWGILGFLFVVVLLFITTLFVKYADTIPAAFKLTSWNSPKAVVSRVSGRIMHTAVERNQMVKKGQVLAYMESVADHEEVLMLSNELNTIWNLGQDGKWGEISIEPGKYKNLGEIQTSYNAFYTVYIKVHMILGDGLFEARRKLLCQEISSNDELRESIYRQQQLYDTEYNVALQDLKMKEMLYEDKVIAPTELRMEQSKMLQRKIPMESVSSSLISNTINKLSKKKELLQMESDLVQLKYDFMQALTTLSTEIATWKKLYLLVAPIDGRIVMRDQVQEKQEVLSGDDIFYVAPACSNYFGILKMQQESFGKIAVGQAVLIRLSSFPFQEYGKLKGVVSSIGDIPDKDGQFSVIVTLPPHLRTDRNMDIPFRDGLIADAEVVTKTEPILYKFLYAMKKVFDAGKLREKKKPAKGEGA